MSFLQGGGELPTIQPEEIFKIGTLIITNAMLTGTLITLLVIVISFFAARKFKGYKTVPTGFQNFFEFILDSLMEFVDQISGSREATIKMIPIIGTVFIYIFLGNVLTLLPPFGALTYDGVPFFRTHTNDFNATIAIALGVVVASHILSIQKHGIINHIDKFIPVKTGALLIKEKGPSGIIEAVIGLFVGVLDIIGEVGKSLSLSLRLFGNMFAGEVLMVVFLGLFALLLPAIWTAASLFTGLIQAVVFSALAASYCAASMKD